MTVSPLTAAYRQGRIDTMRKIPLTELLVYLSLLAIAVTLILPFILSYFGIPYDPGQFEVQEEFLYE